MSICSKALIFVSPGRCGTKRIAELLKEKLPEKEFTVTHQMCFSRIANVVGNLFYYLGFSEKIKEFLYDLIVCSHTNREYFITSDPLTAMIIPKKWVENESVCIVQIIRNAEEFAESFFRLSRKSKKSFIAHNFIPFWQIDVFPLENLFNNKIIKKYRMISIKKEILFLKLYHSNPNFHKIHIDNIFKDNYLEDLISRHFDKSISITQRELSIKSNCSKE